MKKEVGLWIDRRHAVIVTLRDDEHEDIQRIESDVEKRVRYSGASHTTVETAPHDDYAEDKRDRRINDHLTHYYDAIITHLRDATDVYIMGPGEAKIEFQKHMEDQNLPAQILRVEAADKLTDAQIAARVRRSFERHIH